MRESIGGAFLFNLVLIFLGIYIAVMAFAIVYAKAFNSKNHIITLIEQNEGYDGASSQIGNYMAARVSGTVQNRVSSATGGYSDSCQKYCVEHFNKECSLGSDYYINTGACIIKESTTGIGSVGADMYTVVTYMDINIPVIGLASSLFPISGETSVIYRRK